eukprot:scaffold22554_cov23-Cyclotella_meneghiniana.AAC.2
MSVSLAKALTNHKTLVRLQNKICAAIGVANHKVEAIIAVRLANNPFIRLGKNETSANLNQKHGYHYEYAKLLLEEIVKHDKANKGAVWYMYSQYFPKSGISQSYFELLTPTMRFIMLQVCIYPNITMSSQINTLRYGKDRDRYDKDRDQSPHNHRNHALANW